MIKENSQFKLPNTVHNNLRWRVDSQVRHNILWREAGLLSEMLYGTQDGLKMLYDLGQKVKLFL